MPEFRPRPSEVVPSPADVAPHLPADMEDKPAVVKQRKQNVLTWAQTFYDAEYLGGADVEDWMDGTFRFKPDGSVETVGNLDIPSVGVAELPQLARVNGYLNISNNQISRLRGMPGTVEGFVSLSYNRLTNLDGFPQEVGGDVSLSFNPLTNLEGLRGKTIRGDLKLEDTPATSVPAGIELGGQVVVSSKQTDLAADAKAKGYRVRFLD